IVLFHTSREGLFAGRAMAARYRDHMAIIGTMRRWLWASILISNVVSASFRQALTKMDNSTPIRLMETILIISLLLKKEVGKTGLRDGCCFRMTKRLRLLHLRETSGRSMLWMKT